MTKRRIHAAGTQLSMEREEGRRSMPSRSRITKPWGTSLKALVLLASTVPLASAQSCISLAGSTQCSAFNASSISTNSALSGLFPFLAFVSSTAEFDQQLSTYVTSSYVQSKYENILGCNNVTLTNTTDYYARYTTTVLCNAIVQNSITPCGLSTTNSRPLCAEYCAQFATSEEEIAVNGDLCGTPGQNYIAQIRADFTNCALPANSLSGLCISAEMNEPDNCGYSTNLQGLCGYCALSSPNATDSCCVASNVNNRCTGVTLPTVTSLLPLFPSATGNTSTTGTVTPESKRHGLSTGAIVGIVIGSVVGAAFLLGLLIGCCIFYRRRRGSQNGSIFNQPSPKRSGQPQMAYAPRDSQQAPAGRVARMTALEARTSSDETHQGNRAGSNPRYLTTSDSEAYGDTPESRGVTARPITGRRQGSLSSTSMFGALADDTSPNSRSGGQYSSPDGVMSGQSEQLPFFKDYYSQDQIQPHDKVATLWAYQPRAEDEFELERGDMLKVVGIWDDGWATGVRIPDRAEEWDEGQKTQRDSGVSNGGGRRDPSPAPMGEIKAFPLVCVCLPQHWKKTIESDGSIETTSSAAGGPPTARFDGF